MDFYLCSSEQGVSLTISCKQVKIKIYRSEVAVSL